MKKVLIAAISGAICFIIIVLGINFYLPSEEIPKVTSAKAAIVSIIKENYEDLQRTAIRLFEYDIEDRFYLADKQDLEANSSLVKGELYVEHNTDDDIGYIKPEALNDNAIKEVLKKENICEISRGEKLFDFIGNFNLCEDQNGGFCGFYYSLDGKPKNAGFLSGEPLIADGSGWSCEGNEEYSNYYTEKVKGDFFYYEGVFYP